MTARDALAAIRERAATARVRAAEDETDLARWPTRLMSQSQHDRRLLARDNGRLGLALEAVLDLADSIERARFMRVEMSTAEIHTRLTGALSGLEGR